MNRVAVLGPWLVTMALFVTVIAVLGIFMVHPRVRFDLETASLLGIVAIWGVVHASVGTLIAWRRPGNTVGRLMQLAAPLLILVFFGYLIGAGRYLIAGREDLIGGIAAWWGSTTIVLVIVVTFPLLVIVFPDGRLPTPSFRRPLQAVLGGLVVSTVVYAIAAGPVDSGLPDNPFGLVVLPPVVDAVLGTVVLVGLVGSILMAVVATILRWRRGTTVERAQLKWLLAVLVVAPPLFVISWGTDIEPDAVFDLLSIASALAVSMAIGVAVLRYRLYEIDRIISRTLTYAGVTVGLFAVFVAANLVAQWVLSPFTNGNAVAVAGSTLLGAAAFNPLRSRLQAIVDRRFNRGRYDAERTIDAFAGRLRDELDLTTLADALLGTTRAAVEPATTAVWLRGGAPR